MEEWISVTEAAARLTAAGDRIDRSTLSRYLKQHGEALPTRIEGKTRLVELGALIEHRGENIRLRPPVAPTSPVVTGAIRPNRFAGSQSDGAARKAQADAEMREMDLAVRRGELVPVSEVDQAGRDAIALMKSAFDRATETEASTLSVKYGLEERVWRAALKSFARAGLETFNREILEQIDQRARAEFADATMVAASGPAALQ